MGAEAGRAELANFVLYAGVRTDCTETTTVAEMIDTEIESVLIIDGEQQVAETVTTTDRTASLAAQS